MDLVNSTLTTAAKVIISYALVREVYQISPTKGTWITAASVSSFIVYKLCGVFFKPHKSPSKRLDIPKDIKLVYREIERYKDSITNTNNMFFKNVPFFILLQNISKIPTPEIWKENIRNQIVSLWNGLEVNKIIPDPHKERAERKDGDQQDYIRSLLKTDQIDLPDYLECVFKEREIIISVTS